MGASVNLSWDTASVPREERFAYFVDGICRAFTHLDPELSYPDSPFHIRINHREVDSAAVTNLKTSQYNVRRLREGIARSDDHNFLLSYIVVGKIDTSQKGDRATLSSGDMFILDNSKPFEVNLRSQGATDARVVRLPRSPLLDAQKDGLLNFGRHFANHRLMPLLKLNLAQLSQAGRSASDQELLYFGLSIPRMVDLILTDGSANSLGSGDAGVWKLIIAEIDRSVGEPYFTLDNLAARLGVSSRYIQKIFAVRDWTFSEYLRDRRLNLSARCLQDSSNIQSIEKIAEISGFKDLSTFYRSFKRKFGIRPGDMRHYCSEYQKHRAQ